ncbi:CRISPR-associated endoribonuclease Cas6 [Anaeromicropila populeti]|nr:CRISPR-associated endoribonuclease Cas6 [Anaeromicropila populeti]
MEKTMEVLCKFLDNVLCQKEELIGLHNAKKYKNYCFNSLYPTSSDKVYHKNKRYQLQIRTTDRELAQHFANQAVRVKDRIIKVIETSVQMLPKRTIYKLYSISPCMLKTDYGYWRSYLPEANFLEAVKSNLIKKYKDFTGQLVDEDFSFFERIEFINRKPILCAYKNVSLLGDKLDLYISEHPMAQELAYFALGVGILEGNARGFGFVNDKWKK